MLTRSLLDIEMNSESEEFIYLCQVNGAFAAADPVALKKGSWQPLTEYDISDETAVIPCIIPPDKEWLLPMGSEFEYLVSFAVPGESETGWEMFKLTCAGFVLLALWMIRPITFPVWTIQMRMQR